MDSNLAKGQCQGHPPALHSETLESSQAGMQDHREAVLACEEDPAELHRLLTNLRILEHSSADDLAKLAVEALKKAPPEELLRRHRLRCVQ